MSGSSPSQDLAKARTLLGGTWGPPEGPGMPSWELRTCTYRGSVSLCGGPDPMTHLGVYYLFLPRTTCDVSVLKERVPLIRGTDRHLSNEMICRHAAPASLRKKLQDTQTTR
jgi:hypothetical protein